MVRHSVGVSKRGDIPKQTPSFTDEDFDTLSLHDCHIHGIELRTGDPSQGDWTHDLALDIDFIVDGWRGSDGKFAFLVAPAWLVFSEVTGLRIVVEWKNESVGGEVLHPAAISQLVRREIDSPQFNRRGYEWSLELNWPEGGVITFCATSFILQAWADAVETDASQHLSTLRRSHL